MSNPILQSNQSSAVVATVNESQTMSPWVYNETNRLVVPHAMQVLPINHSSGTVGPSKTISFDIAKNGLVHGLWLKVVMKCTDKADETDAPVQSETTAGESGGQLTGQVNAEGFTAMGLLKLIQEIRLTTSGRIVESLDKFQILARIADLPLGQRQAVLNAYRCNGDPDQGGTNDTYEACLWLPFYFAKDSARYHINSNFAEPFQVQVQFSACTDVLYETGTAFNTDYSPQDADLLVHYRQLDEKTINDVISKNYGDGLLSQIVHISKKEALKSHIVTSAITAANRKHAGLQTVEFEMKENDAIESMYIMVEADRKPDATPGSATAGSGSYVGSQLDNCPVEITEVELKFNNTSVLKVPGEFLRYFGRWGMHGMCGDGSDSADGLSPTRHVYKIDFGLDHTKGAFSNIVALREVSNPKCIIKFAPYVQAGAGTSTQLTYNVHVIYDTATFLSTSSATGRVNLSISS